MSSGGIITLILLGVLIVAVVLALLLLKRRRDKEKRRIAAMSPDEREHRDANLEYDANVKAASAENAGQLTARDARLRVAQKAVATANALGSRSVGSYRGRDGSVSVNELMITLNGQSFALNDQIRATVDTAGNLATSSRSTFTRVAGGAVLFGPVGAIVGASAKKNKIHDTRELYLMIESPQFGAAITCNPDHGPRVRQLAVAINNAGRQVEQMTAYRVSQISIADAALAAEEANTEPIDTAAAALEAAKANTVRKDAAAARLAIAATAVAEPTATTKSTPDAV